MSNMTGATNDAKTPYPLAMVIHSCANSHLWITALFVTLDLFSIFRM